MARLALSGATSGALTYCENSFEGSVGRLALTKPAAGGTRAVGYLPERALTLFIARSSTSPKDFDVWFTNTPDFAFGNYPISYY